MKGLFRRIHLYAALAAGLVIMSNCFTGAVLVFEKELQEAFHHDRYFVKQEEDRLPVEKLLQQVNKRYPAATITTLKIYTNPERSVEIGVSLPKKEKKESGHQENSLSNGQTAGNITLKAEHPEGKKLNTPTVSNPANRPTHTVFINPYHAELLELYNYRDSFFYTMFSLHRWLLGGESGIGKTITGIATLVFLVILVTGIILWWPRNKAILKQRLKLKTDANWKRLNHDLHIVLGFYSAIFLFIFACTALAWSFKWVNQSIYTVTGSSMKTAEIPGSKDSTGTNPISLDSAYAIIRETVTDVPFHTIRIPNNASGVYTVSVLPYGAHESASDNYYIDQYSGGIAGVAKYKDKNLGQRVRATFKPVHVGSIFGLPSKIIAFLVCLLGVSFPVTGVIMWINRIRKNNNKKEKIGDDDSESI